MAAAAERERGLFVPNNGGHRRPRGPDRHVCVRPVTGLVVPSSACDRPHSGPARPRPEPATWHAVGHPVAADDAGQIQAIGVGGAYGGRVPSEVPPFPGGNADERELLLAWLGYLRGAVVRKATGVSEEEAHRRPGGRLLPLVGVVNHLSGVEWRWIDGGMLGAQVNRNEEELFPGPELTVADALARYRQRAERTDATVRSLPLDAACRLEAGTDLRWVLLHLINETARHAGHADATRELLDGSVGE